MKKLILIMLLMTGCVARPQTRTMTWKPDPGAVAWDVFVDGTLFQRVTTPRVILPKRDMNIKVVAVGPTGECSPPAIIIIRH